ncbi:DUF4870 domain-containing protein [Candidatus Micrarchaeota archaeon]|nr:DUF4870 domain-containing protein [Candidatus Micrarchaeota archaeon]
MVEKKAKAEKSPGQAAPTPQKPAVETSGGNESNLLAAAGYIIGIIAIIMYLVKKEDKFLRFHSMQSILLWVGTFVIAIVLWIISAIISMIPAIGVIGCVFGLLATVIWLIALVAALYCAYKAFNGKRYELPYLGPMARKYE